MKSAIARCNLQWQLFEPESGGIACFAQCNSTLARELALEVAASAVIHALGTANDAAQFQAALDTLASAPACYLPECWKAAWNALEALSAPAKAAELQAMFTAVLDRLPAHPGLRLQQLRRAARFGSQCSRGTSAWSVESTARLLQLWAEQADMPPRVWRQLLQMQQRTQYRQVATDFERILRTPGLTAEQQDQLQLQMHCMCRRLPPEELPALLARVERVADPGVRLDLLGLLYMVVLMGNPHSEEREAAETQVHQARLRITDPALRKEVLLEIPFEEEIAPRVDLLRELLAFPPVEAIRLLEPQVMTLGVDTHGLLLTGQCMELLLARSRQVPDGHPAFLHTLGRASKSIPDVVLRTRIGGLVLQDSLRLEVGHRLNILAALDGPEAGFRERWHAEWAAALAGTLQALGQATSSASAWHLIHALVPASKKRESCDAVLQAQLAALPLLDPHDQVRALHTICHDYLVDRFDKEDGHLLQFIEAARQLPCYLRPRLGKLLHLLSKEAGAAVKARLGALDEETQAQRQAGLHDRGATVAPATKPIG